jgi:AcrR family transcriptional regulator|tara:strand:- start:108 stop:725 length:618 start_codon:yes stop_codon:yes gene_type:complete
MASIKDGRALRQQNIYDLNRERLINTAVHVINEVGDIREVTLTQIAKEAGVSPATAYNHFPERMEDVYSAIVHSKMDVAANMGATLSDSSLSPIEKLKKIPLTYAENLVSLGYAGKVILIQQFNLIKVDKWLDQDPVQAISALLSSTDEYKDQSDVIALNIATAFRGAMYEYALNIGDHALFRRYTEEYFLQTSEKLVENILKQY